MLSYDRHKYIMFWLLLENYQKSTLEIKNEMIDYAVFSCFCIVMIQLN